jgi:hypothetical protein
VYQFILRGIAVAENDGELGKLHGCTGKSAGPHINIRREVSGPQGILRFKRTSSHANSLIALSTGNYSQNRSSSNRMASDADMLVHTFWAQFRSVRQ